MIKRRLCNILSLILVFLLLSGLFSPFVASAKEGDSPEKVMDRILAYEWKAAGKADLQSWIDGYLSAEVGDLSDWYLLALTQGYHIDSTSYQQALLQQTKEEKIPSAATRLRCALVLAACGSRDPMILRLMEESIGKQGIMSHLFGLHLFNNGYAVAGHSKESAKEKILSLSLSDGGWAVTGKVSDVDVTAMAITALSPFYPEDPAVKQAIDRALELLSDRQQPEGDFASYGIPNPESTAQVLIALCSLGIDWRQDERFIQNGNTLLDGIARYELEDGSYAHLLGGESNRNATVQVFCAMVAARRYETGKGSLYLLDHCLPVASEQEEESFVSEEESFVSGDASSSQAPENSPTPSPEESSYVEGNFKEEKSSSSDGLSSDSKEESSSVAESLSQSDLADFAKGGGSLKIWVSCALLLLGGIALVLLILRKKASGRNLLTVFLLLLFSVAAIWCLDLQTPEEFYASDASSAPIVGKVTLTIRCDTVPDKSATHIPDDGVFLPQTTCSIQSGETVASLLKRVAAENRLHLDTVGSKDGVYIRGIGNLYEFDFGDLSGWVYRVNGEEPSVGCGAYRLQDGDLVELLYSCNMGEDLSS